jgi:hypothetical protein
MAFLWWNSSIRELSEATASIGELKRIIEDGLTRLGFRDVARSELDVAGNKDGIRVSIGHFQIADRRFWEVVMAAGDTAQAKATNDQVVKMLSDLRFL